MTEKNNAQERIEEVVKEELAKANLIDEKESIFTKAKKALTSDFAKEIYGAMALGVLQGVIAKATLNALSDVVTEDDTIIEIED